MKYLALLLLISIPLFLSAQSIDKEVYIFMNDDDTAAFENYIKAGNDIDQCMVLQSSAYSFLTLAIKIKSQKIFAKCITLGADLEKICTDKTPLMYAVKYDQADMVIALLKAGVNRDQKSNKGRTAMDYAKKYEMPHLAKLLE